MKSSALLTVCAACDSNGLMIGVDPGLQTHAPRASVRGAENVGPKNAGLENARLEYKMYSCIRGMCAGIFLHFFSSRIFHPERSCAKFQAKLTVSLGLYAKLFKFRVHPGTPIRGCARKPLWRLSLYTRSSPPTILDPPLPTKILLNAVQTALHAGAQLQQSTSFTCLRMQHRLSIRRFSH